MAATLVDHHVCQVTHEGDRLELHCARRTFSLVGSYALGVFGLVPIPATLILVFAGEFEPGMLFMPFTGVPFLLLSWLYVRTLRQGWGIVEIDRADRSVRWTQKDVVRGTWTFDDVRGLGWGLVVNNSMRFGFGFERWLRLHMADGTRVPLAMGFKKEVEPVARLLGEWGLDRRG